MFLFVLFHFVIGSAKAKSCIDDYSNFIKYEDKVATNPYSLIFQVERCACKNQCEGDTACNGFSYHTISDTCYLSTCNTYNTYIECFTCDFYGKNSSTRPLSCMPFTTMSTITTSELGKQTTMKQKTSAKEKMTTEQTTTEQQSTSKEETTTEQQSTSKEVASTGQQSTSKEETTTKHQSTAKEATTTEQQSTSKEQITYKQESTSKEQTSSIKHSTTKTQYMTMKNSTIEKLATSEEQPTTVARLTILTPSENTMTLNDTAKHILNRSLCVCVCKYTNQTLEESIEKRRKILLLNKTELSSNIRKRMSVPDFRKSTKVVGTVAAIILVVIGLLFFSADIRILLANCHSKILQNNNPIDPIV